MLAVVGALAMSAIPAAGHMPRATRRPARVDAPDSVSSLLRAAAAVVAHESSLGRLWPGFWDARFAFAVFPIDGGSVVIRAASETTAPHVRPPTAMLPPSLTSRAHFLSSRQGSFVFDFDFAIEGRRIAAFSSTGPMASQRSARADQRWAADSVGSFVMFMVHEAFHDFQSRRFAAIPMSPTPFANLSPMKSHAVLLEATWVSMALEHERVALAAAVAAPSCVGTARAWRAYASLRRERLTRLPAEFTVYEDAQERAEGVATWIGLEAVHRIITGDTAGVRRDLLADLAEPYRSALGEPFVGWPRYASWHLYVTGAAKASLLARCAHATWKAQTTAGATLQDALAHSLSSG